MPLFRDRRGRFFLLPDKVLEAFVVRPSSAADALPSNSIEVDAHRVAGEYVAPSAAVAIVIVARKVRTEA